LSPSHEEHLVNGKDLPMYGEAQHKWLVFWVTKMTSEIAKEANRDFGTSAA
jgi:hypothetical protein